MTGRRQAVLTGLIALGVCGVGIAFLVRWEPKQPELPTVTTAPRPASATSAQGALSPAQAVPSSARAAADAESRPPTDPLRQDSESDGPLPIEPASAPAVPDESAALPPPRTFTLAVAPQREPSGAADRAVQRGEPAPSSATFIAGLPNDPGRSSSPEPPIPDRETDVAEDEPPLVDADPPVDDRTDPVKPVRSAEPEPAGPALVRMAANPSRVSAGQRVSLTFEIASATDVGHVPFHVTFDPSVLQFEVGEQGPFLGSDGSQTAFFASATSDGASVVVGLSRIGRVRGVDGSGLLCVLHFNAVGPGDAALAFARNKVRDSSGNVTLALFQTTQVIVD